MYAELAYTTVNNEGALMTRTGVRPSSFTTADLLAQIDSSEWAFHEYGSEAAACYADECYAELERRAAAA